MKPPSHVRAYLAAIGAKGGKAKGASKRRSAAHYERLAAAKRKRLPTAPK